MVLSIFMGLIIDITIFPGSRSGLKDRFIDIDDDLVPTVGVNMNELKCRNHA